ncbi:MAG: helix-turn-helix transcriptional regulator [Ruminiclostridium sp.]|nr:helix-turn-helix transcriptional regulator [Ruminiclostridium sp.]
MSNGVENKQNSIIESFQSLLGKEELLAKVIECFPYPIQIYAPNGTSVMVNKALLAEYHAASPDMVVGKYNILKDPDIIATGQLHVLQRAFQGETIFFPDVKVPLESIAQRYGIKDLDVEAIYQDITVFPIPDDENRVIYVAAFLVNRRVYRGKDEIERAKEYIENHWLERFDIDETARAACLSKTHFVKLFKKHTGVTPHEYHTNYKINKVKEKLLDANITIGQAFAACNMEYSGYSARVFKDKTGFSPSAFRKLQG